MDIYFRERIDHVWLLDPVERLVEVYRWSDRGRVRIGSWRGDVPARLAPFEAVALDLQAIWG